MKPRSLGCYSPHPGPGNVIGSRMNLEADLPGRRPSASLGRRWQAFLTDRVERSVDHVADLLDEAAVVVI